MLLGRSCGQWQGHWLRAPGRRGEQRWRLPQPSVLQPRDQTRPGDSGGCGRSRGTFAGHRADERGINGKLRAVPKRQAVSDDLDAPRIVDRHITVHGGYRDIASDPRPGLADAGDGAFRGYCSGGEHA